MKYLIESKITTENIEKAKHFISFGHPETAALYLRKGGLLLHSLRVYAQNGFFPPVNDAKRVGLYYIEALSLLADNSHNRAKVLCKEHFIEDYYLEMAVFYHVHLVSCKLLVDKLLDRRIALDSKKENFELQRVLRSNLEKPAHTLTYIHNTIKEDGQSLELFELASSLINTFHIKNYERKFWNSYNICKMLNLKRIEALVLARSQEFEKLEVMCFKNFPGSYFEQLLLLYGSKEKVIQYDKDIKTFSLYERYLEECCMLDKHNWIQEGGN